MQFNFNGTNCEGECLCRHGSECNETNLNTGAGCENGLRIGRGRVLRAQHRLQQQEQQQQPQSPPPPPPPPQQAQQNQQPQPHQQLEPPQPSKRRKDKADEGQPHNKRRAESSSKCAASSSKCPAHSEALECEESDGEPYDKDELRAASQSCHTDDWSDPEEWSNSEEEEMLIIDEVETVAAVAAAEEAETVTEAVGTAAVAAAATEELPFKTTAQTLADTDRFFDEAFAVDACAKGAKQSTPSPQPDPDQSEDSGSSLNSEELEIAEAGTVAFMRGYRAEQLKLAKQANAAADKAKARAASSAASPAAAKAAAKAKAAAPAPAPAPAPAASTPPRATRAKQTTDPTPADPTNVTPANDDDSSDSNGFGIDCFNPPDLNLDNSHGEEEPDIVDDLPVQAAVGGEDADTTPTQAQDEYMPHSDSGFDSDDSGG